MRGSLYESERVRYENHVRRSTWFRELWIPNERILVSWVPGGTNLQVAQAEELSDEGQLSRKKISDLNISYPVLWALRRDLEQQQARAKGIDVIALAAKQSEDKLRHALVGMLKLPL